MVEIENITRKEENKKLKVGRIRDLSSKFFEDPKFIILSVGVGVIAPLSSDPFLYIHFSSKRDTMFLKEMAFYEQTYKFAQAYEKKFSIPVLLETDYSKPLDLS